MRTIVRMNTKDPSQATTFGQMFKDKVMGISLFDPSIQTAGEVLPHGPHCLRFNKLL